MDKSPTYKFKPEFGTDISENCPIEITSGEYTGIIYSYGKISLKEQNDENLMVTMDIDLIKAPEGFDKNSKDFTNTVGEIFVNIVESGTEVEQEPVDLEDDVHQDQ